VYEKLRFIDLWVYEFEQSLQESGFFLVFWGKCRPMGWTEEWKCVFGMALGAGKRGFLGRVGGEGPGLKAAVRG
jgi:hypothetical protein